MIISALSVLMLVATLLVSPGKMVSCGDVRTGGLVFEYGKKKKLSVLAGLLIIAITIVYLELRGDYERLEVIAPAALIGVYVLMMSFEALGSLSKTIRLSSTGIEQKSFLGSTIIHWHEVASIEAGTRWGRRLTVKTPRVKIDLDANEVELDHFARAIMEYVPIEKRRHLDKLLRSVVLHYQVEAEPQIFS